MRRRLLSAAASAAVLTVPATAFANGAGGLDAVGELLLGAAVVGVVSIAAYCGLVLAGLVFNLVYLRVHRGGFPSPDEYRRQLIFARVTALVAGVGGPAGIMVVLIPWYPAMVYVALLMPSIIVVSVQLAFVLIVRSRYLSTRSS